MRNVAYRRAFLTFEDLKKAFGIPDEIDIVSIKDTSSDCYNGDVEVLLVSKEPVDGITTDYVGEGLIRRINLNNINK